jgi:hypothetical protein
VSRSGRPAQWRSSGKGSLAPHHVGGRLHRRPGRRHGLAADHLGPNPTADEALAQIGALLIGGRSYQLAKTEEGKPYGRGVDRSDVRAHPRRPGARRRRLHLRQRLFDRPGGSNVKLERISLTDALRVTNLWLRVVQ